MTEHIKGSFINEFLHKYQMYSNLPSLIGTVVQRNTGVDFVRPKLKSQERGTLQNKEGCLFK